MELEDPWLDPMLIMSSASRLEEETLLKVFVELEGARDCLEGPPERVAGMRDDRGGNEAKWLLFISVCSNLNLNLRPCRRPST
jgi:hypothetical protein